jgi:hypothetical protein
VRPLNYLIGNNALLIRGMIPFRKQVYYIPMNISHSPIEIFLHVRVMIGVIVGLSIARLLTGIARFIQHPKQNRVYFIHLGWVLAILAIRKEPLFRPPVFPSLSAVSSLWPQTTN